ncbi:MAG: hypothetical protein IPO86_06800 [Saprospiraceae bacterium]|nr:hypothetical protein [Saprospiraceae bacterium]MBK9727811.1 hypothetical protein [Saprospiraceae bacterium]
MKSSVIILLLVFVYSSCIKTIPNHTLKLKQIELIKFVEPNELLKWDTIDGPDIFITISINNSIVFISDKFENPNVTSVPVSFKLDSNIIFEQGIDEIDLNAYDRDANTDQLIEKNMTLVTGAVDKSPYTEMISCNFCIAEWRMTYEIVK